VALMAGLLLLIWLASVITLKQDLGRAKNKPKFSEIFSKSASVNVLSAARLFLFGARDVWFVVALPVFLSQTLGWSPHDIGSFFAAWVIAYGVVQSLSPYLTGKKAGQVPDGKSAFIWALPLVLVPAGIAIAMSYGQQLQAIIIGGLLLFGVLFAINSSLHSYLIVSYAKDDGASLDVGFYYMSNAMGRLLGTVLSGWVFQLAGLAACLWISAAFIAIASLISTALPRHRAA
jgi:predicted MFS family arabinose efflux permease